MALIQFVVFILLHCFPSTEASESFMLYNPGNDRCLAHSSGSDAIGKACDANQNNQKWRWLDVLHLQNVHTQKCVAALSGDPFFEMRDCDPGNDDQRLICSYNLIRSSHRGPLSKPLGMTGPHLSYLMSGFITEDRKTWEVYGDPEKSICNGKSFRDSRKWQRLADNAEDVSSGLNPWIIYTTKEDNVLMMDSTGATQQMSEKMDTVSLAPHAIWGLLGAHMKFSEFRDVPSNPWSDNGYGPLDFKMPGRGFFFTANNYLCVRYGSTEAVPFGGPSDYSCEPSSLGVLHGISCGVTGCFGIFDGEVYFREGLSEEFIGTGWILVGNPPHERIFRIVAGPIYEIWAITSDGYSYRRLGMSDGIPMGKEWELIPNLLLKDATFGIYGPIGIAKYVKAIITLNGSPTPKRQREMDGLCVSEHSNCVRPGTSACKHVGTICNARFSPKKGHDKYKWRCFMDGAMGKDGQVWDGFSECFYSSKHNELMAIALRYPVLGDFEKQLLLDTFCQNQDVSGCSEPYFAQYDVTLGELICRTVETTSSTCPAKNATHTDLFNMLTRGSCVNNPLTSPLASSQFTADGTGGYYVKLNSDRTFCRFDRNSRTDTYVEIDFLFRHKICAIATVGDDQWFVDKYRISYSIEDGIWNKSSLFGAEYVFPGNNDATSLVKRYLPAPVIARWLRFTFIKENTKKCLHFEVYGSSLETEADSCQYYKDHLSATLDGFYNIYTRDTEIKKRVFCKGITDDRPIVEYPYEELVDITEIGCFQDREPRAMPFFHFVDASKSIEKCKKIAFSKGYEVFAVQDANECHIGPRAHLTYNRYGESSGCVDGKGGAWANTMYRIVKGDKLFWALNTTREGIPGPVVHEKNAVNVLQGSASRVLAIFPNHCMTNIELCDKGLTVELAMVYIYSRLRPNDCFESRNWSRLSWF